MANRMPPDHGIEKVLLNAIISDEVTMFKEALAKGFDINQALNWHGRTDVRSGVHNLKRTPLMVAATHGSLTVLRYILSILGVDVNRTSESDALTALGCARLYGSRYVIIYQLRSCNAEYIRNEHWKPPPRAITGDEFIDDLVQWIDQTENFMIFSYKIKRCTRDRCFHQTCPFRHQGDVLGRRNFNVRWYNSLPCRFFPKCRHRSRCSFAHGEYESLLHPHRFRTMYCGDGMKCRKMLCFNAHNQSELRHSDAIIGAGPHP